MNDKHKAQFKEGDILVGQYRDRSAAGFFDVLRHQRIYVLKYGTLLMWVRMLYERVEDLQPGKKHLFHPSARTGAECKILTSRVKHFEKIN
jgi:hypothetical protein